MWGSGGKQKEEEGEEEECKSSTGLNSKSRFIITELLLSSIYEMIWLLRGMRTYCYFNWYLYLQESLRHGDKFKSITQRPIINGLLNSEVMLLLF